mmetsp:Transcript_14040/g.30494  ORF Transcript_14040/g.30494 Transcript_14040/m.30494 type:complete len:239 (+) Transcript_14040:220-936(+)
MFDESSSSTPASQVEPAEYEALPPSTASSLDVVSFCIDPSAVSEEYCGGDAGGNGAGLAGGSGTGVNRRRGVVGTVTFLADGKSAMIWLGWGGLMLSDGAEESASSNKDRDTAKVVGGGVPPSMGPMALSMPRATYQHSTASGSASSAVDELATTQLIGGESEEDMVVGQQMAARLGKKAGMPVYVCCSVHGASGAGGGNRNMMEGGEAPGFGGSLGQRAAALAELEVGRILLERKLT